MTSYTFSGLCFPELLTYVMCLIPTVKKGPTGHVVLSSFDRGIYRDDHRKAKKSMNGQPERKETGMVWLRPIYRLF